MPNARNPFRPPNRAIGVLFACVALATTAMFTAITVGAIVAVESSGSRATSGLPAALAILGTALGAVVIGATAARSSWRVGMQRGWLLGAVGGVLGVVGVEVESFPVILAAMFAIGFGNAGAQMSRYAAAETVPPAERGSAVSWAVWASAIGAVFGPLSLELTGNVAREFGLSASSGGFLLVSATLVAASIGVTAFRPKMPDAAPPAAGESSNVAERTAAPIASRANMIATVVCLIAAQAAMVGVMSITPVHLSDGGHAYGVVGTVMSGHFVGMFALAPLVGWVVDRTTSVTSIRIGMTVLAVGAALAAAMPIAHGSLLSLPLLLIGLGWCVCFVSSSKTVAMLISDPKVQGRIDSLVWIASASSSIAAGLILSAGAYATVATIACIAVLATGVIVSGRARVLVTP